MLTQREINWCCDYLDKISKDVKSFNGDQKKIASFLLNEESNRVERLISNAKILRVHRNKYISLGKKEEVDGVISETLAFEKELNQYRNYKDKI